MNGIAHFYYETIKDAYEKFNKYNYNKIYIALDIHGTCADGNYKSVNKKLYDSCILPLQTISNFEEVVVILYSCCHKKDEEEYIKLFTENGIKVKYFNCNPEVSNTETGCFDIKFYYNLLVDDKAFFNPKYWDAFFYAYVRARMDCL